MPAGIPQCTAKASHKAASRTAGHLPAVPAAGWAPGLGEHRERPQSAVPTCPGMCRAWRSGGQVLPAATMPIYQCSSWGETSPQVPVAPSGFWSLCPFVPTLPFAKRSEIRCPFTQRPAATSPSWLQTVPPSWRAKPPMPACVEPNRGAPDHPTCSLHTPTWSLALRAPRSC